MLSLLGPCVALTLAADPAPPSEPITPARIQELVKKLEEPTRRQSDQLPGPPDYPWPTFDYRWHSDEIAELQRAGEAAVPALLALLADTSRPGQARAQAAAALMPRLVGTKVKPDPKVVAAINVALADKDPALRYGVLFHLMRRGLAITRDIWEMVKDDKSLVEFTRHWPPVEERAFSPAVMDAFLPRVVALLADEHPEIAAEAAQTISWFGQPKTGVPELIAALKRKEPEVRAPVIAALAKVGQDDPDVLAVVLDQLTRKEEIGPYAAAVCAVRRFGPRAKAAVPHLVEAIRDKRGSIDGAVQSLGAIGPDAKPAVPALLEYMVTPGGGSGKSGDVIRALDQIDPAAAKEARAIEASRQEEFRREVERATPKVPPIPPDVRAPVRPPR